MADTDYSNWQFQDITPAPRAQPADQSAQQAQTQVQPDILRHTPEDYATLTTQQAIQNLHDLGGMPEVGTVQDIFKGALQRAQDKQAELKTEYQKQLQRVLPSIPTPAGKQSLLSVEEQEKAAVAEQQKQFEQGPGAAATAAAQTAAGRPGLISDLPQADREKLDMLTHGYDAVNDLSSSFNYMMSGKPKVDADGHSVNPPLGVGGQFQSLGGHARWFADASSASALNFDRQREATMIPIARAVLGEVGATPTKQAMVEMALSMGLPRIQDDEETGNNQIYNYKKSILEQLQTMHNNRVGRFDTSAIDSAIANLHSDFDAPTTQHWNPIQSTKGIAYGTSQPADATMNNVNSGALKGSVLPQPAGTPGTAAWRNTSSGTRYSAFAVSARCAFICFYRRRYSSYAVRYRSRLRNAAGNADSSYATARTNVRWWSWSSVAYATSR